MVYEVYEMTALFFSVPGVLPRFITLEAAYLLAFCEKKGRRFLKILDHSANGLYIVLYNFLASAER